MLFSMKASCAVIFRRSASRPGMRPVTRSQVLIESQWEDGESEAGAGTIRLRAWGENVEGLIDPLVEALRKLPVGQPPELKRTKMFAPDAVSLSSGSAPIRFVPDNLDLTKLEIPSRPELPHSGTAEIFISYAWGDNSSDDARKHGEVVERMCETLDRDGWKVVRDKTAMR
jgi:hypothetical protein